MRHTVSIALLALVPFSISAPAQQKQPVTKQDDEPLRVVTRNVILDVVVTDKKGNVVDNLKPEDFTVLEDKAPQHILSFEAPVAHLLPPKMKVDEIKSMADVQKKAPNMPITVIVLDELNTRWEDMAYARYTLQKYLKSLPETLPQPTALTVAANRTFLQLHDYTLSRAELIKALADHRAEYPFKIQSNGHSGSFAAENMAATLATLQQIAHATTGHPGRKNMIWVGKGFAPVDLVNQPDDVAATLENAIQRTVNMLRDARITLTTIDPTANDSSTQAVMTPDDLDAGMDADMPNDGPFAGDINFTMLAPDTGGRAVFSRNDIDAEIGTAVNEGSNYYTLSYAPTNSSDAQQKYRKITIKLANPELKAITRDGYYPNAEQQNAEMLRDHPGQSQKLLVLDLATAVNSSVVYTGLNVKAKREGVTNNYKVGISSDTLQWKDLENGDRLTEVTIVIAAFNAKGKMIGHTAQEMSGHVLADKVAASMAQDAVFGVPGPTPVGTTRLRVVVRDAFSSKIGTADLDADGKMK